MRRAFAAGLLMMGCAASADDPPMWRGDVRFSAEERAAIVAGEAWIAAQGGHAPGRIEFDLVVEDGSPPVAWTIRRERGPYGQHGATGECLAGAVYLDPVGRAEVNEYVTLDVLRGLTAHEMAHCRYDFVDAYGAVETKSDGIMRNLNPMRWTAAEEAQCTRTRCRER
jgi:hypothetical protein